VSERSRHIRKDIANQEVNGMRLPSAPRLVPACIVSAAAVAALAAPGAANAALGTQCSGANITAQGSSLQKDAQLNVWNPDFNTSTKSKSACAGAKGQGTLEKPTVKYTSSGSGAGLEAWGVNKKTPNYATNAFVGTDEPPNAAQTAEIEANETTPVSNAVLTIPVVQESVAILVDLPTNCVATSKKDKGRLELNNVTLEGIFRGTIKTWAEIKDDGDAISGAGCNTSTPISVVVRKDQSGTTHIVKKYFSVINEGAFTTEAPKEESKTWTQISEGTENVTWPKSANVVRPASTGGGALITKVAETPGSIGYANLAEARLNGNFTEAPGKGGPNTARFWAPIQDTGIATSGKLKYADPSSNKASNTEAEANCKDTEFTNGSVPFPPKNAEEPWNEVTTSTIEKKYTLCGLTYDLAFTSFSAFPGTSLAEATTVNNYLQFVLNAKGGGGQKLIADHDYLALPKGVLLEEAQKGAALIAF
jgi:ABC-type phosphate transport system substrate-binding protein